MSFSEHVGSHFEVSTASVLPRRASGAESLSANIGALLNFALHVLSVGGFVSQHPDAKRAEGVWEQVGLLPCAV